MFAGIVEGVAKVTNIDSIEGVGARLKVKVPFEAPIGASIAINGVCLTVVECADGTVAFEAINETLRKTNLGMLQVNDLVNIERSLQVGDRIDGHFVSGHVDSITKVLKKTNDGSSIHYTCGIPAGLNAFIAQKGSVTINGVALTVGDVTTDTFSFYIIPHTAQVTNLGSLKEGSTVNVEVDLLARYVVNACSSNARIQ